MINTVPSCGVFAPVLVLHLCHLWKVVSIFVIPLVFIRMFFFNSFINVWPHTDPRPRTLSHVWGVGLRLLWWPLIGPEMCICWKLFPKTVSTYIRRSERILSVAGIHERLISRPRPCMIGVIKSRLPQSGLTKFFLLF